jgi:hypothetical protein
MRDNGPDELLVGGATHFVLDVTDTVIFASGVRRLELCQRRSQEAGGSLLLKRVELLESIPSREPGEVGEQANRP